MRRVSPHLAAVFRISARIRAVTGPLVVGANHAPRVCGCFLFVRGNWACVFWGYPHSVASPLWSVSIEEQFYLVWPFLMRRWAHQLVSVGVVLLLVSFITRIWLVIDGVGHPQIWCNTLARL